MKVAILTTPTKHHTYFANKLAEQFDIAVVVHERRRLVKPYVTGPFLEAQEDTFEERFFDPEHDGTSSAYLPAIAETVIEVQSVNQTGVAEYLEAQSPDVMITFGVGLVKPHIFKRPPWGTVNVHRGIAQEHRGLDSDLWAIHEGRYDLLGITLHYVEEELDTGAILDQERIELDPSDKLYHLRYLTTVATTRMMIGVLQKMRAANGPVADRKQDQVGKYYTAMSLAEKKETLARFDNDQNRRQALVL